MKNNFVKDCLLFGKRDLFCIKLGILTWLMVIGIIATGIIEIMIILKITQ